MKNKYIAALLAFFGGWMGLHRFYLGQILLGIVYIIFMPIAAFVALYDTLHLLTTSQEEFDRKYNPTLSNSQYPRLSSDVQKEKDKLLKQKFINERKALERKAYLEEMEFKKTVEKKKKPKLVKPEHADELAAWHDLYSKGIIDKQELEIKKKEILGDE